MVQANSIHLGDCLDVMPLIANKSVDFILCDLPYGTTQCKWDTVIPFAPLWEHYERIIKDNGAVILTGSQPFTTDVIQSNRKLFRYEIVWEKTQKTGFFDANRRPLKAHENILVFYKKIPVYNPQKGIGRSLGFGKKREQTADRYEGYGSNSEGQYLDDGSRYPTSVVKISNWNGALFGKGNVTKHPTQKPVPLFEYLIKTFTNEGDIVLDNCMGSGTTCVAAIQTGRKYIGIEQHEPYFRIAEDRIELAHLLY